jgi:hypothetical protein
MRRTRCVHGTPAQYLRRLSRSGNPRAVKLGSGRV